MDQPSGSVTETMEARRTCLVVDDSRAVRKVARRILEIMDYSVAEAEDGQAALASCRAIMPDAVLLDWKMPVMNGIDFLRALRTSPGGERPTVVFCTGLADLGHVKEAIEAGADDYIMKPFDADLLSLKLAKAQAR